MISRTKIKICGITNLPDALCAVELGADALGFIFYPPSPRYITPEKAWEIIDCLPSHIKTVAVMVNESITSAKEILAVSGCRMAQLSGSETPEYVQELQRPAIKAISVSSIEDLKELPRYTCARAILLDTKVSGQYGGTGTTFDWRIASQADSTCPIILAGGLTPENVAEAVRTAEPFAVDVSSGIESEPGKKDIERMRQFVEAVREFDRSNVEHRM